MAYRTLGTAADLPTCFTTAVHSFWGNRWKWKFCLVNIEECSTVSMMRLGLLMSLDVFGISAKIIKTHQKSWNPYEIPVISLWIPYLSAFSGLWCHLFKRTLETTRPGAQGAFETTRATANVGGPVGQWLQHCWSKMLRNSNLHLFTYTNKYIYIIYISLLYICCIHLHYYYTYYIYIYT